MKKLATILVSIVSFNSIADMNCGGGGCLGVPDYMLAWPHGGVSVFPLGDQQLQNLSCTPGDGGRALSLPESAGQEKMYAMLLASITAKQDIFIRLPDDDSSCVISYIRFQEN